MTTDQRKVGNIETMEKQRPHVPAYKAPQKPPAHATPNANHLLKEPSSLLPPKKGPQVGGVTHTLLDHCD